MIAALFVDERSVYSRWPGVDAWPLSRNALKWPGGIPCIAHPPCRLWGASAHDSKADHAEKELAIIAIAQVRTWGGVLSHPAFSHLWDYDRLPKPGQQKDSFGGYTIQIDQLDWGHVARKPTWLYVAGVPTWELPLRPEPQFAPTRVVSNSNRSATPPALAAWLISIAQRAYADLR